MSTPFYDLASLVLVPSGYKSQKVYAQKPLTTDGQLTFSRASTATRVNASGLIETVSSNVPRLDYLGSTCPKLQLEPSRTNLALASSDFANVYWEKGGAATITSNTVVSPDGTQNADTLTANGTGAIFARAVVYLATTQVCTNSVFVKKANHRYVGFRNSGSVSNHDVFDFDTKTWTNNSGATLSYDELGNGWFRLKSTNVDTVNGNYYWSVIPAVNTSGEETTTASNLSVYIWGAQAEQNANYATSYIPTTSAAVTRLADACSKTGISSLIGQTEGTLFVEVAALSGANDTRQICINNGTTSNRVTMAFLDNGTQITFLVQSGGSITMFTTQNVSGLTNGAKIAYAYKLNDFAVYVNGSLLATDTNGAVPVSMSALSFDAGDGTDKFFGKVNQALLFKTRLTNPQLAELTAL